MNTRTTSCLSALFLALSSLLPAQTLPVSALPARAQKALKDFVAIDGGSYMQGLFSGEDSLQCPLPLRAELKSFYLNRFEVSVAEYQEFLRETGRLSDQYDSAVWTKDYPYAYNEPMNRNYFWLPQYRQCPVVGITWEQATRYCEWKTEQINQLLARTPYQVSVRLPSQAEWEYAALGVATPENATTKELAQKDHPAYPWKGLFLAPNEKGLFSANCNSGPVHTTDGVKILEFVSDGFLYTAPVQSFRPNAFGLYQMAGNVSEWTSDDYGSVRDRYVQVLEAMEDQGKANPALATKINALAPADRIRHYKIVKGGSWVDGAFYMQCCVAKIQDPKRASCTTGFRPALVVTQGRKG